MSHRNDRRIRRSFWRGSLLFRSSQQRPSNRSKRTCSVIHNIPILLHVSNNRLLAYTLAKECSLISAARVTFGCVVYQITAYSSKATTWTEKPAALPAMLFTKSTLQPISKSLICANVTGRCNSRRPLHRRLLRLRRPPWLGTCQDRATFLGCLPKSV